MSKFSVYALEATASGDYDLLIYDSSEGASADQVKRIGIDTILAGALDAEFGELRLNAATELTISSGAVTATQSAHKLQPESGTTDDLATINGGTEGMALVLYASDAGTDTITIKHATGNISCIGGTDIDLSEGAVFLYYDGTEWKAVGGGGGGTWGSITGTLSAQTDLQAALDAKPLQNMLYNGGFRVAQRGATFDASTLVPNSDGEYTLDRWALLSDGNDIVDVTQEASVLPTGAENAIKLEVETANKQFGILQILEAADAEKIIGGVASLQFKARMAAADDNTHSLKAVVLSWDGTKDAPTLDVVGTWGASITPATNWTAENTPASNTLTTSWQTFTIENISIDTASAKNVAVFIYCDQTDGAIDDAVYIADVKLEKGSATTSYEETSIAGEFLACARYGFVWGGNDADEAATNMWVLSTTAARGPFTLPAKMRVSPSLTISNVSHFLLYNGANQNDPVTSLVIGKASPIAPRLDANDSGGGYTVGAGFLAAATTLSARMIFDAELGV